MNYRDKLHAALKEAGVSHQQVADAIGLSSRQAVTNKLKGNRPIEYEELLAMCRLAGISPSELSGEDALILEDEKEIERTAKIRALSEQQQRMLDELVEQMHKAQAADSARKG